MQKVLRKRIFRDLRSNLTRYMALFLLIVLGMYLIVGMVGAAENIIRSVTDGGARNQIEDGSFSVFVPLADEVVKDMENKGITLERMFYLDYLMADDSAIRIYQNRDNINKIDLTEGKLAAGQQEIVVEKLYAEAKGLTVEDSIEIGGTVFTITGIGSTPDYDLVLEKDTDSSADGRHFGTAFVNAEQYQQLKQAGRALKSEEYVYSYLLNGRMTDEEVQEYLCDLAFDESEVEDALFQEMLEDALRVKNEMQEGIRALKDGVREMRDGLAQLTDSNQELKDGINTIMDSYLESAGDELKSLGNDTVLTASNYEQVIREVMAGDGLLKEQLESTLTGLNGVAGYKEAVIAYTRGVEEALAGSESLQDGTWVLNDGLNELVQNNSSLKEGAAQIFTVQLSQVSEMLSPYGAALTEENYRQTLNGVIDQLQSTGNAELAGQLSLALTGLVRLQEFKEGVGAYVDSVAAVQQGAGSLGEGTAALKEGMGTLAGYNESLVSGSGRLLAMLLAQVEEQLGESGINVNLTETNYQSVLADLMGSEGDAKVREQLQEALEGLNSLKAYRDGISGYTEGVAAAKDGSEELLEGIEELQEKTDEALDAYFNYEIDNLTKFVTRDHNPRIEGSINDVIINKYVGMAAGVIAMILFTFVISVFVIHGIEREYPVIGALYALGAKKGELIRHYLTLPVLITALGGAVGTALGFSVIGTGYFAEDSIAYFSMPEIVGYYPHYLLVYGLIMPPVVAVMVNLLVINKKLSQPALKLMRNEQSDRPFRQVELKKLGYVRKFQVRQFLREIRSSFAVITGMFISLLILLLGVNCSALCNNLIEQNKRDAAYEYMYTFKYPESNIPIGGEACYLESLNKEAYGYDLDVTLLGINPDNPYFDFEVEAGKNKVTLSDSAAGKFKLKAGDTLILEDEIHERYYAFTVAQIVPYSIGLHVFMDISSMRELFGQNEDYYNTVLSDRELNIDSDRLYGVVTRENIEKSAAIFNDMMGPMVKMMTVVSIIIFVIVMYLMMKVMLDRSAYNISLMKVFGYRRKEIKKLYLDGNFIMVGLSALICIPAAKLTMDALYPYFVSNVAVGLDLTLKWYMYIIIYGGIILSYFLINKLLVRRINKMLPAEVLKNLE